MSFSEIELGDLIHVKHGFAFKSEYFSFEGEQIVLTPGNFYESGGFKPRGSKDRFYTDEYPPQYLLRKGDLIIAMTEQGAGLLGSAALIPSNNSYLHNQRLGLVEITAPDKVDKYFLYLVFNSEAIRAQIAGSATGTKVKHTAPERIYRCKYKFPSLNLQQRITSIVSAYDDLIENNLARIKLLEEMAQITYEEWFVRMKFPGHETAEINSETGLPEGWKCISLGEACDVSGGGTPSRAAPEFWDGGEITWFTPTDLSKANSYCFLDSSEKITKEGLAKSSAKLLQPNSFMMTSRATIGLFALIEKPFSTNQGFINITPYHNWHKLYLFYNFKNRVSEFYNHASGATFPELSKSKFNKLKINWPTDNLIKSFDKLTNPLVNNMMNLTKQISLLKEAREILLPRLMTGIIDIENVELPEALLARIQAN